MFSCRSGRTGIGVAIPLLSLCASLTACAGPGAGPGGTAQRQPTASSSARTSGTYPERITVLDNDGKPVTETIEKAPRRVVVLGQNLVEAMIAFGLQDRIVGTAYFDGSSSDYESRIAELPKITDQVPSVESVLALRPDLIVSMSFAMTSQNLGTIQTWNSRGVNVLTADNYTIGRDFNSYFDDIAHIGTVFGVSGKTNDYLTRTRAELQRIKEAADGSGTPKPRVLLVEKGGENKATYNYYSPSLSLVDDMVEAAGGTYVQISKDQYAQMSDESIIKANPDVVIMTQFQKSDGDAEKARLLGDSRLRGVTAIAKKRVLLVNYSTAVRGSLDLVDLTARIVEYLHPGLTITR